jgi:hypothetical protein
LTIPHPIRFFPPHAYSRLKQIYVRSRSDISTFYKIPFVFQHNKAVISSCTCLAYQKTETRCQHIFLCERFFGGQRIQTRLAATRNTESDSEDGDSSDDEDSQAERPRARSCSVTSLMSNAGSTLCDYHEESASDHAMPNAIRPDHTGSLSFKIPGSQLPNSSQRSTTQLSKDQERDEAEAIKQEMDDLLKAFATMSATTKLNPARFDKSWMTGLKANLQTMYPQWQEAIGVREAGSSQRR